MLHLSIGHTYRPILSGGLRDARLRVFEMVEVLGHTELQIGFGDAACKRKVGSYSLFLALPLTVALMQKWPG